MYFIETEHNDYCIDLELSYRAYYILNNFLPLHPTPRLIVAPPVLSHKTRKLRSNLLPVRSAEGFSWLGIDVALSFENLFLRR
jgi:hypothetical protein